MSAGFNRPDREKAQRAELDWAHIAPDHFGLAQVLRAKLGSTG